MPIFLIPILVSAHPYYQASMVELSFKAIANHTIYGSKMFPLTHNLSLLPITFVFCFISLHIVWLNYREHWKVIPAKVLTLLSALSTL